MLGFKRSCPLGTFSLWKVHCAMWFVGQLFHASLCQMPKGVWMGHEGFDKTQISDEQGTRTAQTEDKKN